MKKHKNKKSYQEALKLPLNDNYGFVNTTTETDTSLYLDPILIEKANLPEFDSESAKNRFQDFFEFLVQQIENDNKDLSRDLISKIHENNMIHFGESKDLPKGHGPSYDGLELLFNAVKNKNMRVRSLLAKPASLMMFTPRIGPDSFSDLITNIIGIDLYHFTEKKLKSLNCLVYGNEVELNYWDPAKHEWVVENVKSIVIDNAKTILVPTAIAVSGYSYSALSYISKVILTKEQYKYLQNGVKITKKELSKKILEDYDGKNKRKQLSIDYLSKNPESLEEYYQLIELTNISKKNMLRNDNDF